MARVARRPEAARSPRGFVLYGPTSSGKSALALDVADLLRDRGLRPVVLNADSRQVYRRLDIGTSKITPPEMRGVEHRLLDVADPDRPLSLEDYAGMARRELDDLDGDEAAVPILVGGTGVYVRAVLAGWQLEGSASVRRSLQRDFPARDVAEAFRMLERIDPAAARKVHAGNYEAVINALARRVQAQQERDQPPPAPAALVAFGLVRDRRDNDRQIAATLDAQIERGLVDEVLGLEARYGLQAELARRGHEAVNVVLHTHGYREFFERAVERRMPLDRVARRDVGAVRTAILEHILAYAGRQRAWFGKLGTVPVHHGSGAAGDVVRQLERRGVIGKGE